MDVNAMDVLLAIAGIVGFSLLVYYIVILLRNEG